MTSLRVTPKDGGLVGSIPAPPDAATATLALLVMALASPGQTSQLQGRGLPRLPLVDALQALGVQASQTRDVLEVHSAGLYWQAPAGALEAAADEATIAALCAALAGQRFNSRLESVGPDGVGPDGVGPDGVGPDGVGPDGAGHASTAVLANVIRPLRARGALLEGQLDPKRPGDVFAPVDIQPAPMPALSPLQYQPGPQDWPGKAAALLSGLFADGPTLLQESVVSHERCERLLRALGLPISSAGPYVELDGQLWEGQLTEHSGAIAGDSGCAAALLAAAQLLPDSLVTVRGVAHSGGCRGTLDALRTASASIDVRAREVLLGEGVADISARGAGHGGLRVTDELAARAGASGPILAALAVAGRTATHSELQMTEQAARASAAMLHGFGVEAEHVGGTLMVAGAHGTTLRAQCFDAHGDPELAMAASVLALQAAGPCEIQQVDAIARRFPRFVASLRALGAHIDVLS